MLWIPFTGNSFLSFQCLFMVFLGVIRLLTTHFRSFLTILLNSFKVRSFRTYNDQITLFFFLLFSFPSSSWVLLFHCWMLQNPFTLWTLTSNHTGHDNDSSTCHHHSSQIWYYRIVLSIPTSTNVQMHRRFTALEDL